MGMAAASGGVVGMSVRTGLFHYVPYRRLQDFLACGWMVVADLGPIHGQYSVLCWRCDCGEVKP